MATPQSPGRFGPTKYSYEELAKAAKNFSNSCLLGEGGFGQVYQGSLRGETVAIKKLRYFPDHQTKRELENEIEVVSRVSHRNLVKMLGYCVDGANALLVLEYFPNKSLKVNLHDKKILDWPKRMKIAIGSAKGLEYLHNYCNPKIIHKDIKTDNILLDNSFEPKIADFGLAVFLPDRVTHISRTNVGTEVYADPDNTNRVSDKSDIYSFGVVLLELITGRKSTSQQVDIVTWASTRIVQALEEIYEGFVDSKLQTYNEIEMKRMTYCAAACVYAFSNDRPQIDEIVRALQGYMTLHDIWDRNKDNKLRRITINEDNHNVRPHQISTSVSAARQPSALPAPVSSFTTADANGRAPPYPVMGHNANPSDLPHGFSEMGLDGRTLDFFRNSQQFQALRARLRAYPHLWQPMLQDLWSQNPQIVRFIQEHEADFIFFINEPVDGGEGNLLNQQQPAMPQTVAFTPSERQAIHYGQAAGSNLVLGLNSNHPYPLPHSIPYIGSSGSGAGTLDYFRNSQQFQALKARLRAEPHLFQPMLQDLWSQNPQIVRFIQQNEAEFFRFINEPV